MNDVKVEGKSAVQVAGMLKEADLPMKLSLESVTPLSSRPYHVGDPNEALNRVASAAEVEKKKAEKVEAEEAMTGDPPGKQGDFRVIGGDKQSHAFLFARADFGPYTSCNVRELVFADPPNGCSAIINEATVEGKYALVERGLCAFVEKVHPVYYLL